MSPISAIRTAAELWLIPMISSSAGASGVTSSLMVPSRSSVAIGDLRDHVEERLADVRAQRCNLHQCRQRGQPLEAGEVSWRVVEPDMQLRL